ncbi:type VI secretion system protein TssL, short form [Pseudomonas sp. D2-30]|uniref:type VI secretion system protein TssL, short form n=1 Tax=unclassified Pseudomonas TaxID=196821 RepID=UPI003B673D9A
MTLNFTKQTHAMAKHIDALLQDSYLLVVELRHGTSVHDTQALQQLCLEQVEQVRRQLEQLAVEPRSIEHISHAQCALLDEAILVCTKGPIRAEWSREPLQAKLFNRHQAGEFLYEEMRLVLREPSPDPRVLVVFHRVLMLGFGGRYTDPDDPEREQVLAALDAQVPPLNISQNLATRKGGRLGRHQSPWFHGIAVALLHAGVWWAMDHWLAGVVVSLMPGQA